jgi:hypothetical protein
MMDQSTTVRLAAEMAASIVAHVYGTLEGRCIAGAELSRATTGSIQEAETGRLLIMAAK